MATHTSAPHAISPPGRVKDAQEHFAPQPTSAQDLPDPVPLLHSLARGVLEVFAGVREIDQLSRWLAEEAYRKLLTRATLSARARSARGVKAARPVFRILSLHHGAPADGVVEAAIIVEMPARTRAIAIRLEGFDRRWRATSLAIL